jgi:arginyl-tRNA synthetase
MPNFSKILEEIKSKNPMYSNYYIDYKLLKKKLKNVLSRCSNMVHEDLYLLE